MARSPSISDSHGLRSPSARRAEPAPALPKPPWLRVHVRETPEVRETRALMRRLGLGTVCEEAACPNLHECWSHRHATVMVLGTVCTRACAFCNVKTGLPDRVDHDEPDRLAEAVAELGLRHVVITSVDRDDLADGGAGHFVRCIERIRARTPGTTVEILTPDFRHKDGAIERTARARPDVYNHNVETVPRLYRRIRPGASFAHSVDLLRRVKRCEPATFTKSGLMVGLGEEPGEVLEVMDALREADVDFLTIGQYLRPTPQHAPVARYVDPAEFASYREQALARGFLLVASSPLTRSSYHADADFEKLRAQVSRSLQDREAVAQRGEAERSVDPREELQAREAQQEGAAAAAPSPGAI
ncbi:MAG TPA: lipoyl synthase [Myxococcota bacterium]|nr:lipoyl synthase [Myxococcota bacterium]